MMTTLQFMGILGLIVLSILGGLAAHFFHIWNRERLGHGHNEIHFMADMLWGGMITFLISLWWFFG